MDKLLYPNARKYLTGQPWAIIPEKLDAIGEVLELRANGITFSAEEIQARIGAARPAGQTTSGNIAILSLYGVIDQKVSMMTQVSGGTSVNAFMESFRAALNDSSVSAIVFDVDSPGGSVSGIIEAANEIYAARGKKPIIAVADPMIGSAAYWIASAAREIVCMPSGQVGSVGIIAMHRDVSKANEMMGYKPTYITYGAYKAEMNPDNPLSEDALAYMQGQVNQMGDMFVKFVAKARGVSVDTVRTSFGQGRMLTAKDALAAGMIDSIGTMEDVLARLSKAPKAMAAATVTGVTLEASAIETNADVIIEEDDDDDDPCECDPDNECICGKRAASAVASATNVSTLPEREASKQVLVGLGETVTRWGGLVDRALASGKKPGAAISKANTEQVIALRSGLTQYAAELDGIIRRAGITTPEPESAPDNTAMTALAEFEIIRAREFSR